MPEHYESDVWELTELADQSAFEARRYLETVSSVAAGMNPEVAIPLLLLATSQVVQTGSRLGATQDVVPPGRFEPDVGPDVDFDPLRLGLANLFDGIDEYVEVLDPQYSVEVAGATLSADLTHVASSLAQGLQHFDAGQRGEALWWWQFSYLSSWGERAASALRVLISLLAHVRLDVPDDVAAEAQFDALHP